MIAAGSDAAFAMPDYDKTSYEATLNPILDLAKGLACVFHAMMGTCSTRRWAVIPRDRGQV